MKRDGGHHEMQQPVSPKIATLYADRPSRVSSRYFVQAGHETTYASSGNHHFFQIVYQTYQNYEQSQEKLGTFLENKVF